jgi:hypothetical protein
VNNSPAAVAQRNLAQMMSNSPRALQQRALSDAVQNSPRIGTQRQEMNALFGGPVRPKGDGAMPNEASPAQREEKPNDTGLPDQLKSGIESLSRKRQATQMNHQAGIFGRGRSLEITRAPAVQRAEKTNNTGLPDRLKSGIEALSGMSLDRVKVQYNSDRPAQLQAHAYAQGNEIHLAPGQEKHLPHEAWHVVQQAQGRVRPTMQMKGGTGINDDAELEAEADSMGQRALAHGAGARHATHVPGHSGIPLQAMPEGTPIVQRVAAFRFGTPTRANTYKPSNPVPPKVGIQKHCQDILRAQGIELESMEYTGVPMDKGEAAVVLAAEMHAQNTLGENNNASPFVSCALSYERAAKAKTIVDIVQNASHVLCFEIPDERVQKVGNKISCGETEILVWLYAGESLATWKTGEKKNPYHKDRASHSSVFVQHSIGNIRRSTLSPELKVKGIARLRLTQTYALSYVDIVKILNNKDDKYHNKVMAAYQAEMKKQMKR